ncbi:MAG TPA: c-type cytochrome [Polyangiaceae bacterium]|nr:c-type cytochrome [Polyangiaceae bacterium]
MRQAGLALGLLVGVALATGCRSLSDRVTFVGPMVLAGQEVSAAVLNEGREHYVQNCYACHGMAGDGKGPASHYYRPPPRDLTRGLYKFGGVVDGLPHDEDFVRVLKHGLAGTPMLAWDIPDAELYPIIQYVKSLSSVWREAEELGEQIPVDTDSWQGKERDAIARGKQVYHGLATCQQCHPAYATRQEMLEASKAAGRAITEFRSEPFQSETKESQYEADGQRMRIMPPDFLFNEVRSGHDVKDLYRIISAGIPGTAMPTWYGALSAPDVWAMAYYVQSLIEMRGTPEASALRRALATAPEVVPTSAALDTARPPQPGSAGASPAAAPMVR